MANCLPDVGDDVVVVVVVQGIGDVVVVVVVQGNWN